MTRIVKVGSRNFTVTPTEEGDLVHDDVVVIDERTFGRVKVHCSDPPEKPNHDHKITFEMNGTEYSIELATTQVFGDDPPVLLVVNRQQTAGILRELQPEEKTQVPTKTLKKRWQFWRR